MTAKTIVCRRGQTLATVKQAENLVRELEPAGVACRTLSECLSIQLERIGETGLALTLVRNYLEDIAKDRYNHISKETGVSRQEIQEACKLIRSLNPRPAAQFAPHDIPGYIIPDLLVTEIDGELVVTSGDDYLPMLMVSSYYQKLLKDTEEKEVRDYLTDKVRQASWGVKSIEQRRNILLTCARIIVAKQELFFRNGAGHLEPLTLADVAAEAGVHKSTVSRAIKYKYIQCKHGVFSLGYLFGRGFRSNSGDEVSSAKAKLAIRAIISSENKKNAFRPENLRVTVSAGFDFVSQNRSKIPRRDGYPHGYRPKRLSCFARRQPFECTQKTFRCFYGNPP